MKDFGYLLLMNEVVIFFRFHGVVVGLITDSLTNQ